MFPVVFGPNLVNPKIWFMAIANTKNTIIQVKTNESNDGNEAVANLKS